MTNSAINTPKPTNTGMINQPTTQQTAPVNTPKPTVTPIPTYSGLVGTLAQTSSQPNKDYTEAQSEISKAYKEAADYARDTDLEKKYAMQNPEYRKGYADGTFKPNEPVTRAQLAVILDRLGLLK